MKSMNKIYSIMGVSILSISLLSACGQDTKDITVKDNSSEENTTQDSSQNDSQSDASNKEEDSKDQEVTSKLGSRSNPVPFQKTATVEDELYNDNGDAFPIKFDLTITEVERGDSAYQKLLTMNEYNEQAPEGYEWLLAKAKVKFTESETEDLSFMIDGIMNFTAVSESGDIYSGDIVGTTDPELSFEMYVGNEKEGYIAKLVKKDEPAQLRYEGYVDGQVFFNLQ